MLFGFSIKVDLQIFKYNTEAVNHKSALQGNQGVNKYFATEVSKGAMAGLFKLITLFATNGQRQAGWSSPRYCGFIMAIIQ